MTQSSKTEVLGFDEWLESMGHMDGYQHHYQDAYDTGHEAGAASRQSEIDELKWMLKNSNGQADEFCKKSIDLQKRIDDVIKIIEPSDEISNKLYRKVFKILKGK